MIVLGEWGVSVMPSIWRSSTASSKPDSNALPMAVQCAGRSMPARSFIWKALALEAFSEISTWSPAHTAKWALSPVFFDSSARNGRAASASSTSSAQAEARANTALPSR
ncbi:MAG: hypothetical protein M5U09_03975 [Gammaproteobacteria bacterium]|nr:hypothetical protein [Gammaproteobacteria bacterium]